MTYFWTNATFNFDSFSDLKINYLMPYLPSSGEKEYDENNSDHLRYQRNSTKIYNSKYKSTNAYYYLFRDLNNGISKFLRDHNDIKYVIPVGSTHPLVYRFAEHICANITGARIIDCLQKQDKRIFTFTLDNVTFPKDTKVLLVDDVITSSATLKSAVQVIKNSTNLSYNDIKMLCIGKTIRNLNEWN